MILLQILPLLLLYTVAAVKIGVSKIDTTTKAIITTTPLIPTSTVEEELTTPFTTEESSTTTTIIPSTTTTTTVKTTFPSFAVPTFPTKKTKTAIKTTMPTKTTTSTTTEQPPSDNAKTEIKKGAPTTTDLKIASGNYYCDCNLLPHACDINCCCDPDCSDEALRVFDCNAASKHPELRSHLQYFHYQHGLPSCRVNDGWLCVFRTNIPPQREQVINTNVNTAHYYKWPREMLQVTAGEEDEGAVQSADTASGGFYKYGEPLKLLNLETLEIQNFELPFAFRPPHCHIKIPIKHLKAHQGSCLFDTLDELQEETRTILQLLITSKLMLKPKKQFERAEEYLGELKLRKCFKTEPNQEGKPNCLTIKIDKLTDELATENFYATEIAIKIMHNYTSILAGVVELGVHELGADDTELWQSYVVEFVYNNQTEIRKGQINAELLEEKEAILTSGPLGYLQGEPLIMARFIARNSSHPQSASNQVLSYFHANATKTRRNHTLRLFTRRQRVCQKSESTEHYINYGINTYKQCELRLGNASELAHDLDTANISAICVLLQNRVLAQLFGLEVQVAENVGYFERLAELYISQLGKPANISDGWTPLVLREAEFAPVSGHFNKEAQSFSCRNMLLSAAYEFQIGSFVAAAAAAVAVPHQALVKQAALIFGQRHDLEFTLDEVVAVPLSLSVMFYDLNNVAAATASRICISTLILGILCIINFCFLK